MNNSFPLVSVICLCFNHAEYLAEAIESVLHQSYPNIQLIVVDDASTDSSQQVLHEMASLYPNIIFISLSENIGNCKAFNRGLALSSGEYIIDLAGDDILLPGHVEQGVKALSLAGSLYGVHFTDAEFIREDGTHLYFHSTRFPHASIPQGDIYKELITRYFICSPTMMFTRATIDWLKEYDEALLYEDFDFWVRSSRKFLYCYTPAVFVKKRCVAGSLSEKQFTIFSRQVTSTYKVCCKIVLMNKTSAEQKAVSSRIVYEIKVSLKLLRIGVAFKYGLLWLKNKSLQYESVRHKRQGI